MRISLLQTDIVWADKAANLQNLEKTSASLKGKTDLLVLPEMFSTGFCTDRPDLAETMEGKTIAFLKECTQKNNLAITGSVMITENGKNYNRAFFVFPDGRMEFADKRHLFSMGKEEDFFTAGKSRLIVNYKDFNICVLVCYDIRFPVWSRNVSNEYDLLLYVANFPDSRMYAWDSLLIGRALENQSYVGGVNRIGKDGMKLNYVGHSVMIDAKGKKILEFEEGEQNIKTIELSKTDLDKFREKFPAWKDADNFQIQT